MLTSPYDTWDLFKSGSIIETSAIKLRVKKSNGFLFPTPWDLWNCLSRQCSSSEEACQEIILNAEILNFCLFLFLFFLQVTLTKCAVSLFLRYTSFC